MNKVHLEIDLTTETGKLILGAINAAVNGGDATAEPTDKKKPAPRRRSKPTKVEKEQKDNGGDAATDAGESDLSDVTMKNLQALARAKGKGANRAPIKAKLKALKVARVTVLPEDKWEEMHTFLTELPDPE